MKLLKSLWFPVVDEMFELESERFFVLPRAKSFSVGGEFVNDVDT